MHSYSEPSYSNSEYDVPAVGLDPAVDLDCMLASLITCHWDHHLNTADSVQKPAGSGPSVQILRRSSIVPFLNFRRQSPTIWLMEENWHSTCAISLGIYAVSPITFFSIVGETFLSCDAI